MEIIGIDLDSTLVKARSIEFASRALRYDFTDKHATIWNHPNFPEELREKIFSLFNDPHVMCELADPIEGSQTKIKQWSDAGHKIVLITARDTPIHEATIEMVSKHYPEITDINFVAKDQPKTSIMKQKGVTVWIDDAPHGVEDSLKMGIRTFLISNNYTKYNWEMRKYAETHPELFKVVKLVYDIEL